MKQQSKRYQSFTKVFTIALLLFALTPMLAQGGATAISNAAVTSRIIGIRLN
jgi:hypothetical protein